MRQRIRAFILSALALLMINSCTETEDSELSSVERQAVQEAAVVFNSFDQINNAAGSFIVRAAESSSAITVGPSFDKQTLALMMPHQLLTAFPASTRSTVASADFQFDPSYTTIIDFDDVSGGSDVYPQLSGSLSLTATLDAAASQLPDPSDPPMMTTTGSATYVAQAIALTSLVATDPINGATAIWSRDDLFDFIITIAWTSGINWNYTLSISSSVSERSVTIRSANGRATMNRSSSFTVDQTDGLTTTAFSVSGRRQVAWLAESGNERHVLWDIASLDQVSLTVNGGFVGSFSRAQLVADLGAFWSPEPRD